MKLLILLAGFFVLSYATSFGGNLEAVLHKAELAMGSGRRSMDSEVSTIRVGLDLDFEVPTADEVSLLRSHFDFDEISYEEMSCSTDSTKAYTAVYMDGVQVNAKFLESFKMIQENKEPLNFVKSADIEGEEEPFVDLSARSRLRLPAEKKVWEDKLKHLGHTTFTGDVKSSASSGNGQRFWGKDHVDGKADNKYSFVRGSVGKVKTYVIDTGLQQNHIEFEGKATSFDCKPVRPGQACPVVRGNHDLSSGRGKGHGTHVAGTVLGKHAGVSNSNNAELITINCFKGAGPGTCRAALHFAIKHYQESGSTLKGVINLSLGGKGRNPLWDNAVKLANEIGLVVVVAAGNSNRDACNYYPAFSTAAITVGSYTERNQKSSFSNYGKCVDIWAPGSLINSADYRRNTGYRLASGTSMASPHVAGAVVNIIAALGIKRNDKTLKNTGIMKIFREFANGIVRPPVTGSPVTKPPATKPPVTKPPMTKPPVTKPPVTRPPVTKPPVTKPPVTKPPVTKPPVTKPPVVLPKTLLYPNIAFKNEGSLGDYVGLGAAGQFYSPGPQIFSSNVQFKGTVIKQDYCDDHFVRIIDSRIPDKFLNDFRGRNGAINIIWNCHRFQIFYHTKLVRSLTMPSGVYNLNVGYTDVFSVSINGRSLYSRKMSDRFKSFRIVIGADADRYAGTGARAYSSWQNVQVLTNIKSGVRSRLLKL